ncbi:MAG: hypothetical protein ACRYGF_07855, partial [Janthinobacterium lividum]
MIPASGVSSAVGEAATGCGSLRSGRLKHQVATLFDTVFSFEVTVAVCVLALIALAVPNSMGDPDIWWHLRNARHLLTQHAFVRQDFYSYTASGSPWIDHEWLSELPFYLGWRLAGAGGVHFVTVSVIEGIFAGTFWLCEKASRSLCTAAACTIGAAFISTVSFGPRTLLFGWLCLVLELVLLEHFKQRPKALLAMPLLFGCWVNLHGSWFIGLVVFGMASVLGQLHVGGQFLAIDALDAQRKKMLKFAWIGTLPALFCNPWGWRLVAYPFNFAFRQKLNVANVMEWKSLDLHTLRGEVVAVAVFLLVLKQLWRPRTWSPTELAFVFLGLWSALNYSRFLCLLALLAAPVAARSFPAEVHQAAEKRRPLTNAAILTSVLAVLLISVHRSRHEKDQGMQQFPANISAALSHVDSHRRIFNEFLWGGYIGWMEPERRVFIDSRVDIFEYNGTFKDYLDVIHLNRSLELLDHYKVDYVFFGKDTPLTY